MKKRGISGIVGIVIMIALVIVIGGVVWKVVNNLVSEQLEEAGSCFGMFDKVKLNNKYTCWNSSSNELLFSINVADADIDKIIVSISGEGKTKSYTLEKTEKAIDGLVSFPERNSQVKAPGKNEGLTYISSDFTTKPDSITIYPVVGEKQCDSADTISSIDSCVLLE